MRDKWYSDKRDLVKWSVLLLIAKRHHSEKIFQIAYFRHSHYGKFQVDEKEYEIPSEIFAHFRDIRNITKLTSQSEIVVFEDEFGDRELYVDNVKKFIRENAVGKRCIVFLDPDTGLEPFGKPSHNHVLGKELKAIWQEIPPRWILAFYQHKTNRSGEEWVEPNRKQFSECIDIPLDNTKVAHGFGIANDVVFFFAVK
jgi:hypothetical protein